MRTVKRFWLPASLFLVFLAAGEVKAEFVTATLNGTNIDNIINPGADVTINLGDGTAPSISYKPGEVNWTGSSSNSAPFKSSFISFCIQLNQDISPGTVYKYTLANLQDAPTPGTAMGATKANEIEQLWGGFFNSIGTDGTKAAAFQLAIWKIESDWGDAYQADFSTSNSLNKFQASGNTAATSQATTWLNDLKANTYATADLRALTSDTYQDQVVAVPVPPGFTLAGIGVLCLLGYGYVNRRARLLKPVPVMVPAR